MLHTPIHSPDWHVHESYGSERQKHKPIATKALGTFAVIGNVLAGSYELAASNMHNVAGWLDGGHGFTDGMTHGMQTANIHLGHRLSRRFIQKSEAWSRNILATSALAGVGLSGWDFTQSLITERQAEFHGHSLTSALASAAVTAVMGGFAWPRIRKKGMKNLTTSERGWVDHIKTDAVSAGLAVMSSLPGNSPASVAIAGVAGSTYGFYKFNYWKTGHEQCHHHEHDDHEHSHRSGRHRYQKGKTDNSGINALIRNAERKGRNAHRAERQPSRLRRSAIVGMAALGLTFGSLLPSPASEQRELLPASLPAYEMPAPETICPHHS